MNNLAFYLAQIYYNLTGNPVNPVPTGFSSAYWSERIYRYFAGLPDVISGGKNASFWLELWFYVRTNQTYRLAIGDRPEWFWLSKLYASYKGFSPEGMLQSSSAEFWAEKLLNILPAEISVTVNSIAQADNSTFAPSNPILGTVVQYTVRATNNGTATLTLQNATRSGAVTAVTAWSSNALAPGASATCTITLDTASSGVQTGYFEFVNNDPDDDESTYRVNVSFTVDTAMDRYSAKVLALNPIQYLPLNQLSGTAITDLSAQGNNAVASNVTWDAVDAPVSGQRAPGVSNSSISNVNLYSAGLAGDFSATEGTLIIWGKTLNSGAWSDAANRYFIRLGADDNNEILIVKSSVTNQVIFRYRAGGTANSITRDTSGTLNWMSFAISWKKANDRVRAFYNGTQEGADVSGLGIWAGTLTNNWCWLASRTGALGILNGYLFGYALFAAELTPAQIASLAVTS